ncbi:hypothetical protein M9Y10_035588 [Tritrichomonas musculus]|uniref:DUF1015 domain-containing protein n=1 Tax=Tritrichomonas musculus TaxID=1915356 RepID=A0ABR2GWX7_9EUKA
MKAIEDLGICMPEILLPAGKNMMSWPVIACDQYTQDKTYWQKLSEITSGKPSTLNLILPEIYLENNKEERISKIRQTMREYLENGVFQPPQKCFVYIERTTPFNRIRKGLIALIDLEKYEWKPLSKANIRATEKTIVERIPPRIAIRKGAPLELPHIMLLADDKSRQLVEKTGDLVRNKPPLYQIDLMCGGGSVKGWSVSTDSEVSNVTSAITKLATEKTAPDGSIFLFAVGDGNHSLATAKAVWDDYKKELKEQGIPDDQIAQNPVRWALVEIVNMYDEGLTFEPIHRVVFGADSRTLISDILKKLGGKVTTLNSATSLQEAVKKSTSSFGFAFNENGAKKFELLEAEIDSLAVSVLQPALDEALDEIAKRDPNGKRPIIDYIHGSDELVKLGERLGATAILLPPVSKDSFFETINHRGSLPNKSFSMGEADEKRFYLECRRLFP